MTGLHHRGVGASCPEIKVKHCNAAGKNFPENSDLLFQDGFRSELDIRRFDGLSSRVGSKLHCPFGDLHPELLQLRTEFDGCVVAYSLRSGLLYYSINGCQAKLGA